ncbi:MAG: response regulator [Anaerolineales bacterium]|nr:response regulator [Anaerolineales bacterium]
MAQERILVVDGDPDVLKLCLRSLRAEGYIVEGATSGHQAIEIARKEQFDLLLVDIMMPEPNGLEVYQAIKEFTPEMVGVIITGSERTEEIIKALQLGFDDFVVKPFTPDWLSSTVAKTLNKRRLERENVRLWTLMPLFELSKDFLATLDLNSLLDQIVQTGVQETKADRASLMLLEGLELVVKASAGLPSEIAANAREKVGEGIAGWVAGRGEPLLLADGASLNPQIREAMIREEIASALCVPLLLKDKVIGVLNISKLGEGPAFTQGDLEFVSILGGEAAIAIENARLYREAIEEKRKTETILEGTFDGLVVIDNDMRITSFNPGAEAITGHAASQVLGKCLTEVFGSEVWGDDSFLQKAASTGERVAPQEVVISGKLRSRDALLGITLLYDSGGEVFGYLLSFADITHLKEVDRLKSNIVANVSHELRAPLASIKAYTELLLDELEGDDRALRQRFLTVIDQETDRLTGLIGDLLDLSRLEAGQFVMKKEPLRMGEIVDDILGLFDIQAQESKISLHADIQPDLPPILADRELVNVLIKNLVGNAIKFSHEGGRVDVVARKEGANLILSVIDQGMGIPPDDLPHIFEKFYRVWSTTESGIEGVGLGLVLAKEAAEAHGGQIEVESELGMGSRFIVTLPILLDSVQVREQADE